MSVTLFTANGDGQYQNRGRAVAVNKWNPTVKINFEEWGWFEGLSAIITRVGTEEHGNYQFLHTLGDHIYLYVFGDRIGQMVLGGLAAPSTCQYGGGILHGIEYVNAWYALNKISSRLNVVYVLLGQRTVIPGYVVGLRPQLWRPEEMIMQFSIDFAILPQN